MYLTLIHNNNNNFKKTYKNCLADDRENIYEKDFLHFKYRM